VKGDVQIEEEVENKNFQCCPALSDQKRFYPRDKE
jgi:hypothetical protein